MLRSMKSYALASLVVGCFGLALAAEETKPKRDIKAVMDLAHKQGLFKKVSSGKASDDEKKELLSLYVDLANNDPPKGDQELWKKTTEAITKAAKAVVAGDKGSEKALQRSVNCAACHKSFKP